VSIAPKSKDGKVTLSGKNSFSISADMSELDALLDGMEGDVIAAVRPAAQAAAQVLYNDVVANVQKIKRHTGNLQSSIYQAFSQSNSGEGFATYHVSWNAKKAPHGHLVEFGHLQRYQYYKTPNGQIRPMVRPEMQGKPKPGRRASQSAKDAYYVTLPSPVQVPAKPFIRPAAAKFNAAMEAAKAELYRRMDKRS